MSPLVMRTSWLLFIFTLIACTWFFSRGNWAQHSRYQAIYAIVKDGTLSINRQMALAESMPPDFTGDWARHPRSRHYYSNKAPATAFLGAAVFWPVWKLEQACRLEAATGTRLDYFNRWWINFWCSALPTALAAMLLFQLLAAHFGFTQRRALFWSLAFVFATPLWPYATQMWGHNLGVLFLVAALPAICDRNASRGACILAGLAAGAAVLADYLAIAALPFFALHLVLTGRARRLPDFLLGGLPALALYCIYHQHCFGNPLLPATFFNNEIFQDSDASHGIVSGFSTIVLLRLLIGLQRGLFWASPVLLLAFPGIRQLWKDGPQGRRHLLLFGGWFLAGLLLNASFNGWHGGNAIGPRYLILCLPAILILAAHFPAATPARQWFALALALASAALMFIVCELTPCANEHLANPIFGEYVDTFLHHFPHNRIPLLFRGPLPEHHIWFHGNLAVLSPGRLVGGRPWSDLALLALLALAFLRLARVRLPLQPKFPRRVPAIAWLVLAGFALLLAAPGLVQFGPSSAALLNAAFQANAGQHWAHGATPAVWVYQVLLLLTPHPIALVVWKALLVGVPSLWLLGRLARRAELPFPTFAALFLFAPALWLAGRELDAASFALPFLLLAFDAALRFRRQPAPPPFALAVLATCAALAFAPHAASLFPVLAALLLPPAWRRGRKAALLLLSGLALGAILLAARHASPAPMLDIHLTPQWLGLLGFRLELVADRTIWRLLFVCISVIAFLLVSLGIAFLAVGRTRRDAAPAVQLAAIAALHLLCHTVALALRPQDAPATILPVAPAILILAAFGASASAKFLRRPFLAPLLSALGAIAIVAWQCHFAFIGTTNGRTDAAPLSEQWEAISLITCLSLSQHPVTLQTSAPGMFQDDCLFQFAHASYQARFFVPIHLEPARPNTKARVMLFQANGRNAFLHAVYSYEGQPPIPYR